MKKLSIFASMMLAAAALSFSACGGSSSSDDSSYSDDDSYYQSDEDLLKPYVGKWDATEANGAMGNVTYYLTIKSDGSASLRVEEWGAGYSKTLLNESGTARLSGQDLTINFRSGEYAEFQAVNGYIYFQDGGSFSRR